MYQRCIFCSAHLGANEVVEAFPVGRRIAFDEWKGRLWAICPRCRRWNLAPLEERWEAVEEAEKHFRDCRVRAHSENIGLARMPDGTRLVFDLSAPVEHTVQTLDNPNRVVVDIPAATIESERC